MQTFRVLKCVECKIFQVDLLKKAKKWSCKICNQKQSVFKVYFESNNGNILVFENYFLTHQFFFLHKAKDCREKSQEMNVNFHENSEKELMLLEEKDEIFGSEKPVETRISLWDKFIKKEANTECSSAYSSESKEEKFTTNTFQKSSDSSSSHKTQAYIPSYSIYHQSKSSPLPKLANLHQKSSPAVKSYSISTSHDEPPSKKTKTIDGEGDFSISQDYLDFIDSLH